MQAYVLGGNSVYDSSVSVRKLLGVVEAVPFVALSIQPYHTSSEAISTPIVILLLL